MTAAIRLVAGAHDGLSAALVERAGFDAVWAGGFGISASQLLPDWQLPQLTPHFGSTPQVRPRQSGTHWVGWHAPTVSLQLSPLPHEPQLTPHTGSKPHTRPPQSGTHAVWH